MKRRRLVGLAVLWAAVTTAVALVPGCYGQTCDGSSEGFGRGEGEGHMIDEDTWESAPIDGKWLFFPGARIYFFDVPALGDRKPQVILPYISPVEDPNVFHTDRPPANFTIGGGNLSELSGVGNGRFVVRNGTCADYWLRVVVHLEPRPPLPDGGVPPPLPDEAGAPDDAGVTDSGTTDAGADAAEAGP